MSSAGESLGPDESPGKVQLTNLDNGDLVLGHIWPGGFYQYAFLQTSVTGVAGQTLRYAEVTAPAWMEPGQALPVMLCYHGGGGWGCLMRHKTGFDAIANEKGFIVVYLAGTHAGGTIQFDLYWNAGGPWVYTSPNAEWDDIAYTADVLDRLATYFAIEDDRVYACGFSNGGAMVQRVGAEMRDRVAAVAACAGHQNPLLLTVPPDGLVNLFQISGTADPVAPYEGGAAGAVGPLMDPFNYDTVGNGFHAWKANLNSVPRLRTYRKGASAQFHRYSSGAVGAGGEVMLACGPWEHAWPGGQSAVGEPGAGTLSTTDFNASREIWDFCKDKRVAG